MHEAARGTATLRELLAALLVVLVNPFSSNFHQAKDFFSTFITSLRLDHPILMAKRVEEKKGPVPSEKFCAPDADVSFVSPDGVLFKIHRKNLEPNAGAFPPAEFDTRGEVVALMETSGSLELLFQFIYPQHHPDLKGIPFNTLALLAEAAEKYQVFAAMNICKIRMELTLPEHPVEIVNYAYKHGHTDILNTASTFLLDISLDDIVLVLSPTLVVPWVRYAQAWSRAAFNSIYKLPAIYIHPNPLLRNIKCTSCRTLVSGVQEFQDKHLLMWAKLGEKRSRIALEGMYTNAEGPCAHFNEKTLCARLGQELDKVPSFDTFL